jgi:hypothetical protein
VGATNSPTFVNAINAAKYFMPIEYGQQGTKEMLMALATAMVHNPDWLAMRNSPNGWTSGAAGTSRSGRRYAVADTNWHQVRIDGAPPPCKHVLILLSQLEGYKGAKQQRC